MIRAVCPESAADLKTGFISGWNLSPNVAYTLTVYPGESSGMVLVFNTDQSTLLASGLFLTGIDQPVVLMPQSGQTVGMLDDDLGYHFLMTTTGSEPAQTIRYDPFVDGSDQVAAIYSVDDLAIAQATAAIFSGTHYTDDTSILCPLGMDAWLGSVCSATVHGESITGDIESISFQADPSNMADVVTVRRMSAILPDAPVVIVPPSVADDAAETDSATTVTGNVLTNDASGLIVVAVDGLESNVGIAVAGSAGGVFTVAADGAWTFDPDGDFATLSGSDTAETSVTYHASNGQAESMARMTVTVSAVAPQVDAYTNLLLRFDGSFADASQNALVATVGGNAAVDTLYPKFGSGCLTLDGAGDYIDYPSSSLFEISSGDFAAEFWYRPTVLTDNSGNLFDCFFAVCEPSAETITYWAFLYNNTRTLYFRNGSGEELITPVASGFSVNTWYHLAYLRDGSTYRLYKNGVQISTGTGTIGNTQRTFRIGSLSRSTHAAKGRFADFRFSKGVCRYPGGTTFNPTQL